MSPTEGRRRTDRTGARGLRLATVATCLLLLCAGVVVTATAAPGPPTDVKTAQYGGGSLTPATKGPCKGIGGEAGQTCRANARIQYRAALTKCRKRHGKARTRCQKAAKKKWVG